MRCGLRYLSNSRGEPLFKGPLSDFELGVEEAEKLVYARKEEGFFEILGLHSARIGT